MSFTGDIQGQNTQLYPIVVIDGEYYSTNNVNIDGNYCKPILMNIPSIKESVDIESRKFKISNLTIELNNYPFEGARFSDRFLQNQLINKEISVYYKSPSTDTIDSMYAVYHGTIRRVTHDDEKVRLESEDLTEKKSHKSLPLSQYPDGTSGNLDDSQSIPDKYKNKPIPIVYGEVNRSPLVGIDNNLEFLADRRQIAGQIVVDSNKFDNKESSLYLRVDEYYLNVREAGQFEFDSDTAKYILDIRNPRLFPDDGAIQSLEATDVNPSFQISISNPLNNSGLTTANFLNSGRESLQNILDESSQNFIEIDSSTITSTNYGFPRDRSEYLLFDLKFGFEPQYDVIDVRLNGISINGYNISDIFNSDDYGQYDNIFYSNNTDGTNNSSSYLANVGGQTLSGTVLLFTVGDSVNSTGQLNNLSKIFNLEGTNLDNDGDLFYDVNLLSGGIGLTTRVIALTRRENSFSIQAKVITSGWDIANEQSGTFEQAQFEGILSGNFNNIALSRKVDIPIPFSKDYYANIKGRINLFDDHPFLVDEQSLFFDETSTINLDAVTSFINSSAYNDAPIDIQVYAQLYPQITNDTAQILQNYLRYYFTSLIQNPIDIIYDILRSELGLSAEQINEDDYEEARTEHGTWKFGFTLNKKTDSKKLIEDIAKSTKCFPKFRSDGTFGFNTIKNSYSIDDYNSARTIKQSDVISYSFKKTKPEQIYRQVDVQYNMDYAQDSLLSRTDIKDNGASDFYGIEQSSDAYLEFESPYIRDRQTAENLRDFLAAHYKNDHLIFNLKLPLQYINLEIGQLVKFTELFQGLKAYGIDYRILDVQDAENFFYPLFMITSITKNLDSVSIECMQLHALIDVAGSILEIVQFNSELNISDSDPLTITPFIPLSEGEILGENLWTNQSFDSLIDGDNIVFDGNQYNIFGSPNDPASTNILEVGKLYRWEFEIVESNTTNPNYGIKIYPEQHAPAGGLAPEAFINEVGKYSFDLIKQPYYTSHNPPQEVIILRMFAYYFDGKIKNNISVREVIQEGQANLLISGGTFENPDNWTPPNGNLSNTKIEDGFLSLIDITSGGTARDNTIINTTLTDELEKSVPIGDFYYSQERFDIQIEVEGNGGLLKLGGGNSQAYFYVSGEWFNVQSGVNTFTGIRVSSTSDYNNFELAIFVHANFNYGKIKSVTIVPSASQDSSVAMKRKTYIVQLIEDGIHFQDNKYDLKDLKDME